MRAVAIATSAVAIAALARCRAPAPSTIIDNRPAAPAPASIGLRARTPQPPRAMIARPRAEFLTAIAAPNGICEEALWSAWRDGLERLANTAAILGSSRMGCAMAAEHAMAAVAMRVTHDDGGSADDASRRVLAWAVAEKLASSPARALIAQRNLAEARWTRAERTEDDRDAWVDAADAFIGLPDDRSCEEAEAAAWINAIVTDARGHDGAVDPDLVERATGRANSLPTDLADQIRAAVADAPFTKPAGSAHKRRAPY